MNRFTILVDAGYFMRQSVEIMSAKVSHSRSELTLRDPNGLMRMLIVKASAVLNNQELLRIYWYDGIGASMTAEHRAILELEDVQIRAGTINARGQQKGVDSRIVTDLVELASNHAICDVMLITGDGDLAIGIELAQRRGVRVAVMGVEDLIMGVYHSQSPEVTNIADRVIRIGKSDLEPYLSYVPAKLKQSAKVPQIVTPSTILPTSSPVIAPTSEIVLSEIVSVPANVKLPAQLPPLNVVDIENAVTQFLAAQNPPVAAAVSATGSIESPVDKALLFAVMSALGGGRLTNEQRNYARTCFRNKVRQPSP